MRRTLACITAVMVAGYASVAQAATDWNEVERIIGATGSMQAGDVYKIGLPRSDMKVKVDGLQVKPALALSGWVAFKGDGDNTMVMGDLVLAQDEISPVMQSLVSNGFEVTAIHNHLLRASPFPMYMHVSGHGNPLELAKTLHTALAKSHTPLVPAGKRLHETVALDTKALDDIMGSKGKVEGGVYKFSLPRKEKLTDDGMDMPASMGMASAIGFQPAGKDKAAVHGDLVLVASEVMPVLRTLRDNGIEVTALHNHMIADEPRLFFMHFWAVDNPLALAKGMRAALDKTAMQ